VNIVETIKNQISGPVLGQLSSVIGSSEGATRSAVGAAVPALLSAFSGLASTGGGLQKLLGTLQRFDPQASGSMAGLLNESPEGVAEKGQGMAESLLGIGGAGGIADALSRSFGISSGGASKLVGFLTPTVLGAIAHHFSGRTIDAQSLTSFFSDQKRKIVHGMPAGFGRMKEPVRQFAGSAPPSGRWLLPAVLGLAAVAVAVFLMRTKTPPPARPEAPPEAASRLGSEFQEATGSLTGTLSGITDEASAEAALPKIAEARGKLDEIRSSAALLPQEGRSTFDRLIQPPLAALQAQSQRVAAIPGAGEKLKPVLEDLLTRLNAPVGGAPVDRPQEVR
jgi:hypothetical protein